MNNEILKNAQIIGTGTSDLILNTFGKVYIKVNDRYYQLEFKDKEITKNIPDKSNILIINNKNELNSIDYPGDNIFIIDLEGGFYVTKDGEFKNLKIEEFLGSQTLDSLIVNSPITIKTNLPPLNITSNQLIENLNSQYLNGKEAKEFTLRKSNEIISGNWTIDKILYINNILKSTNNKTGYDHTVMDFHNSSLDIDYINVRKSLRVYEYIINKIKATNGSLWVSDSGEINKIDCLEYQKVFDDLPSAIDKDYKWKKLNNAWHTLNEWKQIFIYGSSDTELIEYVTLEEYLENDPQSKQWRIDNKHSLFTEEAQRLFYNTTYGKNKIDYYNNIIWNSIDINNPNHVKRSTDLLYINDALSIELGYKFIYKQYNGINYYKKYELDNFYETLYGAFYNLNNLFNKFNGKTYRIDIKKEGTENIAPFYVNDIIQCKKAKIGSMSSFEGVVTSVNGPIIWVIGTSNSTILEIGDVLVRMDNTINPNRKGAIYLTSSDYKAPYIDIIDNSFYKYTESINKNDSENKNVDYLKNYPLSDNSNIRIRLGRLDGLGHDGVFGRMSGMGLFLQGRSDEKGSGIYLKNAKLALGENTIKSGDTEKTVGILFNPDGSGYLAKGGISWNKEGVLTLKGVEVTIDVTKDPNFIKLKNEVNNINKEILNLLSDGVLTSYEKFKLLRQSADFDNEYNKYKLQYEKLKSGNLWKEWTDYETAYNLLKHYLFVQPFDIKIKNDNNEIIETISYVGILDSRYMFVTNNLSEVKINIDGQLKRLIDEFYNSITNYNSTKLIFVLKCENTIDDSTLYLKNIMKNGQTTIGGGLVLSNMLAVTNIEDKTKIKAFMSGERYQSSSTTKSGHIFFAADKDDTLNKSINYMLNNTLPVEDRPEFIVYEDPNADGTVKVYIKNYDKLLSDVSWVIHDHVDKGIRPQVMILPKSKYGTRPVQIDSWRDSRIDSQHRIIGQTDDTTEWLIYGNPRRDIDLSFFRDFIVTYDNYNPIDGSPAENAIPTFHLKGNFFADGFVSARGLDTTSGAGGGGLIQRVYKHTELGGTFNDSLMTDTFNAYTVNKLHTRISTLESGTSSVSWGTGDSNYIPLTVNAVSKNISLYGHTHSQYALSSSLSDYLPLSGGTMFNIYDTIPLTINGIGNETGIRIKNNGIDKSYFGWANVTNVGTYMYNAICRKYLGIRDNGVAQFDGNQLLDTGNYTNYAVARKVGYSAQPNAHYTTAGTANSLLIRLRGGNIEGWMVSFTLRIYASYDSRDILIQGYNYGENGWHLPKATMIAGTSSIGVEMGWDAAGKWVRVSFSELFYMGATIFNVNNGYSNYDWTDGFTITPNTGVPSGSTVQFNSTLYPPYNHTNSNKGDVNWSANGIYANQHRLFHGTKGMFKMRDITNDYSVDDLAFHNDNGSLVLFGNVCVDCDLIGAGYNEGIRLIKRANNWTNINFGCDRTTSGTNESTQWIIGSDPSNNFKIAPGSFHGSSGLATRGITINRTGKLNVSVPHVSGGDCLGLKIVTDGYNLSQTAYDNVLISARDVATLRLAESDGTQLGLCGGDLHSIITSTHDLRFYTNCAANSPIYAGAGGGLRGIFNSNGLSVYGDLTTSGNIMASSAKLNKSLRFTRNSNNDSGISFYADSYNAWQIYMTDPASGVGHLGNLTAPSGSIVTSWALRSVIEPAAGYGWTWETVVATGTNPIVVAELSSDGVFRTKKGMYSDGYVSAKGLDSSSDRTLKENIKTLNKPTLPFLLNLSIKTYQWKDDKKKGVGLIAQDLLDTEYSYLTKNLYGTYSIDTYGLLALNIKATQELYNKIINSENKQNKKLENLNKYCKRLENLLSLQDKEIENIKNIINND